MKKKFFFEHKTFVTEKILDGKRQCFLTVLLKTHFSCMIDVVYTHKLSRYISFAWRQNMVTMAC